MPELEDVLALLRDTARVGRLRVCSRNIFMAVKAASSRRTPKRSRSAKGQVEKLEIEEEDGGGDGPGYYYG
jgi:hypothetical protein